MKHVPALLRPESRRLAAAIYVGLPVAAVAVAVLLRGPLLALSELFPPCPFHSATGLLCPGCGNTRSFQALMRGDLLASLRYNAVPLVLLAGGVLLYAEWGTALFGKRRRLLPRSPGFWILFGIGAAVYFVVRNFYPLP